MGLESMKKVLNMIVLMLILTSCGDPNEDCCVGPKEVELGESFSINEGETIHVENSIIKLTFSDMQEDSLCPSDVTCVTEGTLMIAIDINGTARTLSIGDDQSPSTSYKDYIIELERLVYPTKLSEKENVNSTYAVQMLITKS